MATMIGSEDRVAYLERFNTAIQMAMEGKDLLLEEPDLTDPLNNLVLRDAIIILCLTGDLDKAKFVAVRREDNPESLAIADEIMIPHFEGKSVDYDTKWLSAALRVIRYSSSLIGDEDGYMLLTIQMILEKALNNPAWVSTMHKAFSLNHHSKLMVMATMLYFNLDRKAS